MTTITAPELHREDVPVSIFDAERHAFVIPLGMDSRSEDLALEALVLSDPAAASALLAPYPVLAARLIREAAVEQGLLLP